MSKLSQLLDRVSGRNRSTERTDAKAAGADSSRHGGKPHPNAETAAKNDPGDHA